MTLVLDTSVLVDYLRGLGTARDAFETTFRSRERLVASVLVKVELLAGMRRGEEGAMRRMFQRLVWQDVDDPIAERAGALAGRYLASHRGIDATDYVIAATAERWSAPLWTRNVKHFPMFPGLQPPYEA